MVGGKTYEPIPRGQSFPRKHDICARHEQSELFSRLDNESLPFSEKHTGSLPRHFCDECWHGAAWNQTLRENAEFIDKTGDHKSPTVGQRFQGVSYDILGRLVNEAKLSISLFPSPPQAIAEIPS